MDSDDDSHSSSDEEPEQGNDNDVPVMDLFVGNFNNEINELNAMYDPAHYVMMFPKGDLGYSNLVGDGKGDTVLKFYQQRMQIRPERHVSLCHNCWSC